MAGFWSRLFRSRVEVEAERAEVDGRFDDAARLYVEAGQRDEAFRVLVQAAEASDSLARRRDTLTRAYAMARTEAQQNAAAASLARVTVAEFSARSAATDGERLLLQEAAVALERSAQHREAAQAYKLLGNREGLERCLMLAGDVDSYDRETSDAAKQERDRLHRRSAFADFDALWIGGDRDGALAGLERWVVEASDDHEARALLAERRAKVLSRGRMTCNFSGESLVVVAVFPCVLGREADVSLRGAGISREHCVIDQTVSNLTVRDNQSRNGTTLGGLTLAGMLALEPDAILGVGPDMFLRVEKWQNTLSLVIERGMDRGRRIVLVERVWRSPLGELSRVGTRLVLTPSQPVKLGGMRVVVPITLALGDRIENDAGTLEVLEA
ncbi:MAG: FHA domain-containing protein [Deltaproteobacteria bacterium]|nr:FHA domain-containing protein [Deltaproteobacteria bacterium]